MSEFLPSLKPMVVKRRPAEIQINPKGMISQQSWERKSFKTRRFKKVSM